MTTPRNFYLTELEVRRKRRSIARDAVPSWEGHKVADPRSVAEIFCSVLGTGLVREHLVVFMLDVRNRVMGYEVANVGTAHSVETSPSDVFRAALLVGASAVVLAHNHPSGDPTPSGADVVMTARMVQAGDLVGIPVLDHVVVCDDTCASIRSYDGGVL